MNLLHITCSSRGAFSESTRLSALIVSILLARHPGMAVSRRNLAADALHHVDEEYAQALVGMKSIGPAAAGARSLERSEALITELEASAMIVVGTPIHNFTVPSVFKAWIDHVVRANKTFGYSAEGKIGLLADRPVFVAIASGGVHAGENASQPDFLTPYLREILGTIGLHDVTFFRMQGLARGENAIKNARRDIEIELAAHFSLAS